MISVSHHTTSISRLWSVSPTHKAGKKGNSHFLYLPPYSPSPACFLSEHGTPVCRCLPVFSCVQMLTQHPCLTCYLSSQRQSCWNNSCLSTQTCPGAHYTYPLGSWAWLLIPLSTTSHGSVVRSTALFRSHRQGLCMPGSKFPEMVISHFMSPGRDKIQKSKYGFSRNVLGSLTKNARREL